MPTAWEGFTARRVFRGVLFNISVTRTGPGKSVKVRVDGETVEGRVAPLPSHGTTEVTVEVAVG